VWEPLAFTGATAGAALALILPGVLALSLARSHYLEGVVGTVAGARSSAGGGCGGGTAAAGVLLLLLGLLLAAGGVASLALRHLSS